MTSVDRRPSGRKLCPGSDAIPSSPPDLADQWCPACGAEIGVGDNGCIVAHPMRYAAIVEHMAHVVTELERGWWGPIWAQPNRSW